MHLGRRNTKGAPGQTPFRPAWRPTWGAKPEARRMIAPHGGIERSLDGIDSWFDSSTPAGEG